MSDEAWNSGPPPAIGWFPASNGFSPGIYRWWDGERWSFPATKVDGNLAASIGLIAASRNVQNRMMWQHQPRDWPANARTYPRD